MGWDVHVMWSADWGHAWDGLRAGLEQGRCHMWFCVGLGSHLTFQATVWPHCQVQILHRAAGYLTRRCSSTCSVAGTIL